MTFTIRTNNLYRYLPEMPKGCQGALYRVHAFVLDVPSYQEKVLVEAVNGVDRGLWFVVTPANFAERYELVPPPTIEPAPAEAVPEKVAGRITTGVTG